MKREKKREKKRERKKDRRSFFSARQKKKSYHFKTIFLYDFLNHSHFDFFAIDSTLTGKPSIFIRSGFLAHSCEQKIKEEETKHV